jgi:hypothetical protein
MSPHGIEARFILSIRIKVFEQKLAVYENIQFKENPNLNDKINALIFPQSQTFSIGDKSAFLEKAISIDPKSTDAKLYIIQNVSNLIESTSRLETWFDEFFSNQMRWNINNQELV